jgi:hypothetical protein
MRPPSTRQPATPPLTAPRFPCLRANARARATAQGTCATACATAQGQTADLCPGSNLTPARSSGLLLLERLQERVQVRRPDVLLGRGAEPPHRCRLLPGLVLQRRHLDSTPGRRTRGIRDWVGKPCSWVGAARPSPWSPQDHQNRSRVGTGAVPVHQARTWGLGVALVVGAISATPAAPSRASGCRAAWRASSRRWRRSTAPHPRPRRRRPPRPLPQPAPPAASNCLAPWRSGVYPKALGDPRHAGTRSMCTWNGGLRDTETNRTRRSSLACRIGHLAPVWQPFIEFLIPVLPGSQDMSGTCQPTSSSTPLPLPGPDPKPQLKPEP